MKIVLSYGMGVDSTAILLRWLTEPASRDFDLSDLVIITAQVGDEFESTGRLLREHILPRMREAGVRFIQVARGGLLEDAGIKILDDSQEPTEVHLDGVYRVADELRAAATIPTTGCERKCTLKYKGWVLDRWLETNVDVDIPFRHVIGFNADEMRRVRKDKNFGGGFSGRVASFPLVEWGWGREKCESYIREVTGVEWRKSACTFCPFSCGRGAVIERYKEEPAGAAQALEIEDVALRFNPRMKLFKDKSLRSVIEKSGNDRALELYRERMDVLTWTVYRMRRVMLPKDIRTKDQKKKRNPDYRPEPIWNRDKRGRTVRSIERHTDETMTKAEAEALTDGGKRIERDTGDGYPRIEVSLVAAPDYVAEKTGCGPTTGTPKEIARKTEEAFQKLLTTAEEVLTKTLEPERMKP